MMILTVTMSTFLEVSINRTLAVLWPSLFLNGCLMQDTVSFFCLWTWPATSGSCLLDAENPAYSDHSYKPDMDPKSSEI